MILLEKNVGALYSQFGELFPADLPLWKQLAHEEDNHASLIDTLKEYILDSGDLLKKLLVSSEETLSAINAKVEKMLDDPKCYATSREDALSIALQLEQSAGEVHFQCAADDEDVSVPLQIFNQLTSADKDHIKRIQAYMEKIR